VLGDTTPATSGVAATRESAKRRLMEAEQFNPRSTSTTLTRRHRPAEHLFEILPDLLRRG